MEEEPTNGWQQIERGVWTKDITEIAPPAPKVGTVEWAQSIDLPPRWRPAKRLGALAAAGSVFHTRKVGMSILPQYMTRKDLVRAAEAHETAAQLLTALDGFSNAAGDLVQTVDDVLAQDEPKG